MNTKSNILLLRLINKCKNLLVENRLSVFFVIILLFYLTLHYLVPLFTHLFVRKMTLLHQGFIQVEELPVLKTLWLNILGVVLGIVLIYFSRLKFKKPEFTLSTKYTMYLLIFLYGVAVVRTIVPNSRTYFFQFDPFLQLVSYKTITTLFVVFASGIAPFGAFIFTLLYSVVKGSRAIAMYALFVLFTYISFNTDKFKKLKKLSIITILLILASPWLFSFSSYIKMANAEFEAHNYKNNKASKYHLDNILQKSKTPRWDSMVGRISFFERGGIPILYTDQAEKNPEYKQKLEFFKEKNDLLRQVKLFSNAFIIGEFFEWDHSPNQYHKYVFWGYRLKQVGALYHSISISLPSYFYIYLGFWGSVIAFGIFSFLVYAASAFLSHYSPMLSYVLATTFYPSLLYFDWNSYWVSILFAITCLTIVGVPVVVKKDSYYTIYDVARLTMRKFLLRVSEGTP